MTEVENKSVESTDTQTNTATAETTAETVEQTQEIKFSQADVDKIVADRIARERRKFEKKYEGIDIEQYQELTAKQEQEKQERLKAKGEFEAVLKDITSKKDAQISALQNQISSVKIDGALIDTASKYNAVSPAQVVQLLKSQVKLNEAGDVEVIDAKTGQTRYGDDGTHLTIDSLVKEFLTASPHFVAARPSGSGATSKVGESGAGETVDISKLNMNDPKDREVYKKYRAQAGLGR